MTEPGWIVVLNGAPGAGKSSIVRVVQETFDGPWMNLGVDVFARAVTPARAQPGIGLRPGGERPDLEPFVRTSYAALYDSIAAHSRNGLHVIADVDHHDSYSTPLHVLPDVARRIDGLPTLFVGVRCPIDVIMQRRELEGDPPPPVVRWQHAVHTPGIYDLDVDTSVLTPEECAARIRDRLDHGPPGDAFARIAAIGTRT